MMGYHEVDTFQGRQKWACDYCPEFETTNLRVIEEHIEKFHTFEASGMIVVTDKDGRPK